MPRYITAAQYKNLTAIPRSRMSSRPMIFTGCIVEDDKNRLLMIKNEKAGRVGYDFPGGRVLWNELIKDAAVREVLEESGFDVNIRKLLGIFQRETVEDESEYIRIIFVGKAGKRKTKKVDPRVSSVEWVLVDDILKNKVIVRSPEVLREINEYVSGKGYPLEVIDSYLW